MNFKARDYQAYPVAQWKAYQNDLQSCHCNFILVKRDEHYKAYHMTICICKTCYMILQTIKAKLVEFFVLCNWSELYDVLLYDELHYLKLKQCETYVELLYINAYLTTKVDRSTIDLTDMYLLKTKEKRKKPCNHKTGIRHEEIIGLIVNVNESSSKNRQ